jgi:hypothetical protein
MENALFALRLICAPFALRFQISVIDRHWCVDTWPCRSGRQTYRHHIGPQSDRHTVSEPLYHFWNRDLRCVPQAQCRSDISPFTNAALFIAPSSLRDPLLTLFSFGEYPIVDLRLEQQMHVLADLVSILFCVTSVALLRNCLRRANAG